VGYPYVGYGCLFTPTHLAIAINGNPAFMPAAACDPSSL